MLMRKMLVLAVAQAGIGVSGAPVPGTDAILARTAMPAPIQQDYVRRPLLKGVKGNYGVIPVGEHGMIEFETEVAHVGAAGTISPLKPLLQSCEFAGTNTEDVSDVYSPTSADCPYLTLWCYLDNVLFKLEDAWGTVSFEGAAKGIPVFKWRFIGKYIAMTDANVPTNGDFSAFMKPKPWSKVNVPTFTIHGYAVKLSQFSWDMGVDLKWRELINVAGTTGSDRSPTARAVFELTTNAQKNWAETCRQGTEGAIQIIQGTGGGNIVQQDFPKAQFSADPTIQDQDGHAMLSAQFALNPDAGDDEIVLTFK
jgi:hypothetical protein